MLYGGQLGVGSSRPVSSSISKRRSKPTVERYRGAKSKVLIATSSGEQHGSESAGHLPAPVCQALTSPGGDRVRNPPPKRQGAARRGRELFGMTIRGQRPWHIRAV